MICSKFLLEEQIKELIKVMISAQVRKEKTILEELIVEISEANDSLNINTSEDVQNTIIYRDSDNSLYTEVFDKFHLKMINNELNRTEDQHVAFFTRSGAGFLWGGYIYGFYYSYNDEPIDVVYRRRKCELEFEDKMGFYNSYHYKTN